MKSNKISDKKNLRIKNKNREIIKIVRVKQNMLKIIGHDMHWVLIFSGKITIFFIYL